MNERFYAVQFRNVTSPVYLWAENASVAMLDAIDEVLDSGHNNDTGGALVRPAVYGEWDCASHHFHNDGTHSHDYEETNRREWLQIKLDVMHAIKNMERN